MICTPKARRLTLRGLPRKISLHMKKVQSAKTTASAASTMDETVERLSSIYCDQPQTTRNLGGGGRCISKAEEKPGNRGDNRGDTGDRRLLFDSFHKAGFLKVCPAADECFASLENGGLLKILCTTLPVPFPETIPSGVITSPCSVRHDVPIYPGEPRGAPAR